MKLPSYSTMVSHWTTLWEPPSMEHSKKDGKCDKGYCSGLALDCEDTQLPAQATLQALQRGTETACPALQVTVQDSPGPSSRHSEKFRLQCAWVAPDIATEESPDVCIRRACLLQLQN